MWARRIRLKPSEAWQLEGVRAPIWRAAAAAAAFISHIVLAAIVLLGIRAFGWFFHWLWGEADPLLLDIVPLRYFFDAAHAAILVTFITWGTVTAWKALKE